jgi:hypothetical protein
MIRPFHPTSSIRWISALIPLVVLCVPALGFAEPFQNWESPGPTAGQSFSRWLAPYLRESVEGVTNDLDCESGCGKPGRVSYR